CSDTVVGSTGKTCQQDSYRLKSRYEGKSIPLDLAKPCPARIIAVVSPQIGDLDSGHDVCRSSRKRALLSPKSVIFAIQRVISSPETADIRFAEEVIAVE
ncbi:MAG: hypothetical protein ACYTE3_04340, partial [Planctomycetota bacterium]